MERIGIAASKIAKGNLFLYNLSVIMISFLFSLFVFFLAAAAIILALIVIDRIVKGVAPDEMDKSLRWVAAVCMVSLTVVVGFFNLVAISKNIKLKNK